MPLLSAQDLRSNLATWAVPGALLPAATRRLADLLPAEVYDPDFRGQELETTYLDTPDFALRQARRHRRKYLTLRVRFYRSTGVYALSAKTEAAKFRQEIPAALATALLAQGAPVPSSVPLPGDLLARLLDLAGQQSLIPVVTVRFRRYAGEDAYDRLTLDTDVRTDTGKRFPASVLEHKSVSPDNLPYPAFPALGLKPIKLSKFLWATRA
jgi:hypothetical protein